MNKTTYQPCLIVYIVWHPECKEGDAYAQRIYSLLNSDVNQPVSRGLGIPVFFRHVVTPQTGFPLEIDLDDARQSAVVVLVDDAMVAADDQWETYLQKLEQLTSVATSPHRLFPISLSANAFNLDVISETHFIRLHDLESDQRHRVLEGRLMHELCRLLMNQSRASADQNGCLSPAPVKLFISHAKKDGEHLADSIRSYVNQHLALKTFFDAVDIAPGYRFDREIDAHLKNAALLILLTDAYASRPWCRREVIRAKQLDRPMLAINAVKQGEERSFPYLGNIPTIRWDPDQTPPNPPNNTPQMQSTFNRMLREVLKHVYLKRHFENLADLFFNPSDTLLFSRPPELITLLNLKQKTQSRPKRLLYPDPPLGDEELNVLTQFAPDLHLTTPILLGRQV